MGTVTVKVTDRAGASTSIAVPYQIGAAATLFGGNFGAGPDTSRYPAVVPVARLFHGGGYPDDITTLSAYRAAKAKNAQVIILDEIAGTSQAKVTGHTASVVDDGLVCINSVEHEPEHGNKMTPAAWVAAQVQVSPWIRAAGGRVGPILQAATAIAGGATLAAYALPPGTVDHPGFDEYPETKAIAQAQQLPKILAAAQIVYGTTAGLIFGEYGVPGASSKAVAEIEEFQAWCAAHGVYAAAYFSMNDTILSAATAAAWF